mmetsp:Transcript_36718/g.87252  ORF Transcript_36718/g.87252 Transcript_36718/m.87252 type:complete len:221 (-) Transcript_36718:746-1408(-)
MGGISGRRPRICSLGSDCWRRCRSVHLEPRGCGPVLLPVPRDGHHLHRLPQEHDGEEPAVDHREGGPPGAVPRVRCPLRRLPGPEVLPRPRRPVCPQRLLRPRRHHRGGREPAVAPAPMGWQGRARGRDSPARRPRRLAHRRGGQRPARAPGRAHGRCGARAGGPRDVPGHLQRPHALPCEQRHRDDDRRRPPRPPRHQQLPHGGRHACRASPVRRVLGL